MSTLAVFPSPTRFSATKRKGSSKARGERWRDAGTASVAKPEFRVRLPPGRHSYRTDHVDVLCRRMFRSGAGNHPEEIRRFFPGAAISRQFLFARISISSAMPKFCYGLQEFPEPCLAIVRLTELMTILYRIPRRVQIDSSRSHEVVKSKVSFASHPRLSPGFGTMRGQTPGAKRVSASRRAGLVSLAPSLSACLHSTNAHARQHDRLPGPTRTRLARGADPIHRAVLPPVLAFQTYAIRWA